MSSFSLPRLRHLLSEWALVAPLRNRNYRLLWIGSVISFIGANLSFVALPWLVLKLTNDPLAIGSVLAVAGIPRALFMLFGGAATDRYSPRSVMIWSTASRLLLMGVMSALVYTDVITLWIVFVLAFTFGILDAFFWPASSAILPSIVEQDLLPAGNALIQGCGQLSLMAGPVIAGLIISLSSGGQGVDPEMTGIAFVFFLDVIAFAISLITLVMIRLPKRVQPAEVLNIGSLMRSLKDGFGTLWDDVPVRLMTLIIALFTLFFRGPYLVGIPVLADARFEEGALAFGLISSAFGVGALIGIVAAGSLPRLHERWYGLLLLVDMLVLGSMFFVFAYAPHVEIAMIATAIGGLIDGYMVVLVLAWMQTRIPEEMIGRVMSFFMFFNNGLAPVSAAAAGWFLSISLQATFVGAGAVLVILCFAGLCVPVIRRLGMEPSRGEKQPDPLM